MALPGTTPAFTQLFRFFFSRRKNTCHVFSRDHFHRHTGEIPPMAGYGHRGTIYEDPQGYGYGPGYGPAPALYGPGESACTVCRAVPRRAGCCHTGAGSKRRRPALRHRAFLIESLPPPGEPYYEEYYEKPMPQVQTVAVMPEPMRPFPPPMPEPVVYMSPRVSSPQPLALLPQSPKQRQWCVVI